MPENCMLEIVQNLTQGRNYKYLPWFKNLQFYLYWFSSYSTFCVDTFCKKHRFYKMRFLTMKTAFFRKVTRATFCSPCPYLLAPKKSAVYLYWFSNGACLKLKGGVRGQKQKLSKNGTLFFGFSTGILR